MIVNPSSNWFSNWLTQRYLPEFLQYPLKHAIEHLVPLHVPHCFEIQYFFEQGLAGTTKKRMWVRKQFQKFQNCNFNNVKHFI